jgi:hypothetical protein
MVTVFFDVAPRSLVKMAKASQVPTASIIRAIFFFAQMMEVVSYPKTSVSVRPQGATSQKTASTLQQRVLCSNYQLSND